MAACDPILTCAAALLEATPGLSKTRIPGQIMASQSQGPGLIDAKTLDALRAGDPLDQDTLRSVIWALDLMAAGRPDQAQNQLDPEVQRVAGKLRERFSRSYKMSAYAGLRAT